jgi:hypothetical protein
LTRDKGPESISLTLFSDSMMKFPRSEPELVTHVGSVTHASEREPRATQVYSALADAAVISAGSAGY